MQLKQITFVLENCDSITVEGKHVGAFDVINMREEIAGILRSMDIAKTMLGIIYQILYGTRLFPIITIERIS